MVRKIAMNEPFTFDNFNEESYLSSNADVAQAVRAGHIESGQQHFKLFGQNEGRSLRRSGVIKEMRKEKLKRFSSKLRKDMDFIEKGDKFNYLSESLRIETRIIDTDSVSANNYDDFAEDLISEYVNGIILDCGAGRRPIYYENVLNYEIVDYDTTDVIGVGEALPFEDGTFDAVISIAVLEHVRDPFRCAKEISRVLKPGGKLLCSVPFLQPEHGYPHHYYNMAPQGLRALWEDMLVVDDHRVIGSMLPIWTLTWFLKSWVDGLSGAAREQFMNLKLGDLTMVNPHSLIEKDWVTGLSSAKNMELACATLLFAHKPL